MADDQQSGEDRIIALYRAAEAALLSGIASILAGSTDWLLQAGPIRRLARRIADQLAAHTRPLVARMVAAARKTGDELAIGQLEDAGHPFDFTLTLGEHAERLLREDLVSKLDDVRRRITRLPDDVHKFLSAEKVLNLIHDRGYTPAQAQAILWREFQARGVTGFVDKAGRQWSLSSYVEMAVRTVAMRAQNDAHLERLTQQGVNLFIVPPHATSCPLCFPWQGKVLSQLPSDEAEATIDEARAAGLFHPNCRHTLAPFFPGSTTRPETVEYTEAHRQLYEDTQKQRALERAVRDARRDAEHALTQQTKAEGRRDVRAAQKRLKDFVDVNPHLARDSRREQLDLRDDLIPVRAASTPRPSDPVPRNPDGSTMRPRPDRGPVPHTYVSSMTDAERDKRLAVLEVKYGVAWTDSQPPASHEVEFYERFLANGQRIRFTPRDTTWKPTNDFDWLNAGGTPTEVKSLVDAPLTFLNARNRIRESVKSAAKVGVVKDTFILDFRDRPVPDGLLAELARYNLETGKYRIKRLYVFVDGELQEIRQA